MLKRFRTKDNDMKFFLESVLYFTLAFAALAVALDRVWGKLISPKNVDNPQAPAGTSQP